MPNKGFLRVCAVLMCLALGLALAPALNSAEKTPRLGSHFYLKQPGLFLAAIFPWLNQDTGGTAISGTKSIKPSMGRVKPTNDVGTNKPGGGD